MRRRYREPVFVAFTIALIASLSVHLPVYDVLGELADHLRALAEEERKKNQLEPVEVEFDVPDPSSADRPKQRRRRNAKRKSKPQRKVVQAAKQAEQKPPPPPQKLSRQAIQQRSQNPDVEPPEDPRYVAQENQRVEEETVAKVRNYIRDDPETALGRQKQPSSTLDQGNAQTEKIADARDKEGSEARTVTEDEAKKDRPDKAIDADPIKAQQVASESPNGKRSNTTGDRAGKQGDETITITDGAGTFTVSRPSKAGQGGGQRSVGRGAGNQLTWSKFEAAVGADKLREDRRARIAEHKSTQQGVSREKNWNQFRAAIENFTPAVKPGSQTALNAAASPFANYIAAVHRRLHREFADRFLRNLPMFAGSPYSDPTLMTELEIVLNRDGSVHRVGIARSSGLLPFDFGAFNSVLRGQPYPPAPGSILSGDGRVYFHWGFYKNQRQCGTFNAEPYILPNPPGTPARGGPADGPDWETVVPSGAQPTWRTGDEPDNSEQEPEGQRSPRDESPPGEPKEEDTPKVPPAPRGSAVG